MKPLSRFFSYVLVVLVSASGLLGPGIPAYARDTHAVAQVSDWGSITTGQETINGNPTPRWYVILENSQIKVKYAYAVEGGGEGTPIINFIIKKDKDGNVINEDQAGGSSTAANNHRYLDNAAVRGLMTSARVKYDGPDRKTVRLEWDNGSAFQDVSIFPDQAYLKIDYHAWIVDIVEQGTPGGGSSGAYAFYGGDTWVRGYGTYPTQDFYYDRYPGDFPSPLGTTPDPSSLPALTLRYNANFSTTGYFIGGVYRSSNNRGYGRVMPVKATTIIKLLYGSSNTGFEWFPYFGSTHTSYTGYLYALTGVGNNAPDEIITTGQELADEDALPKNTLQAGVVGNGFVTKSPDQSDYVYGAVVTMTAQPAPGWTFTGWSGALAGAGSTNPAQLTLTGNKVVTATFALNPRSLTVNVVGNGMITRNPDKPRYSNGEGVTLTATAGPGWTFTGWSGDLSGNGSSGALTMTSDKVVTATFTANNPQTVSPTNWWNGGMHYRLPFQVSANGYERYDKPTEVNLNFTQLLTTLGVNGTLDLNSLRVVEVNAQGSVVDDTVDWQFDPSPTFEATTNAQGTLILLLKGTTASSAVRYYHVYFDTTDHGPFTPVTIAPQVIVTDGLTHAEEHAFRIQTRNATYYYHKVGGAFASMEDTTGTDWISYHPMGGSAGEFRGIPNMGQVSHPGDANGSSSLISQGPLKTTIQSVIMDNQGGTWILTWEIFPAYAKMALLQKGPNYNYWFLYEGTPNGKLTIGPDFYTLSTGVRTYITSNNAGDLQGVDIPDPEWVYFGDDNAPNHVLYEVHHEDDTALDQFWQLEGNMTVFGFGRQYKCCGLLMSRVPEHFTIGFADGEAVAPQEINSAYRDLVVIAGQPVMLGTLAHAPVLAPIGDKLIGVGQTLNFTVSASDPDGTIPAISANNRPGGTMFLDNGNGTAQFAWTPVLTDVGGHTLTFIASDGVLTDSESITITVTALPVTGGNAIYLPLVVK